MLKVVLHGVFKEQLPKGYKRGVFLDAENILEVMEGLEQLLPIKSLLNQYPANFLLGQSVKTAKSITPQQAGGAWSLRRDGASQTLHIIPGITGNEITMAAIITAIITTAISIGVNLLISALFPPSQPGTDKRKSALFESGLNTQREGIPLAAVYGKRVLCGFNVIEADVDITQTAGNSGYVAPPGTGAGGSGSGGTGGGYTDDGGPVNPWVRGDWVNTDQFAIFGAKGSPKTLNNNLFSNATLRILGEAGAGKLGGLDGDTIAQKESAIIVNEVPLRDAGTGQYSSQGFKWTERLGELGHGSVPITPGVSNTFNVTQELKKLNGTGSQIYITNTVSDSEVARVKARIKATLLFAGKKGDQYNTSVTVAADVKRLSDTYWRPAGSLVITGKSTDPVQRELPIAAPPIVDDVDEAWLFRIYRVTPDSDTDKLENSTAFTGWTEIIDRELPYDGSDGSPASYLFGAQIDLSLFDATQPPEMGLWLRGRFVRVPINFDPLTRVYTGIWNGTWKYAYTDDPVWNWLDMATDTAIGGGLPDAYFNKFALLECSKFASQLVNGRHRFTLNKQFTDEKPLWDTLREVAQTFRAVPYWNGNQIVLIQDRPTGTVDHYVNNSAALEATFQYDGVEFGERVNEVEVEYDNPDDYFRKAVVVYRDQTAINRLKTLGVANGGVIKRRVYKVGCSNKQEAYDYARNLVYVAQKEWETVTWTTMLESCTYTPGAIIEVDDGNLYDQNRGRIKSVTANTITLSEPVTRLAGASYELRAAVNGVRVVKPLPVLSANETGAVIGLTAHGLTADTPIGLVHLGGAQEPRRYRIISLAETGPATYQVTAQYHYEDKYTWVEGDAPVPIEEWPALSFQLEAPSGFGGTTSSATDDLLGVTHSIQLNWQPVDGMLRHYHVEHFGPTDNGYSGVYDGVDTTCIVSGLRPGTHHFTLTAVNIIGASSEVARATVELDYDGPSSLLKAPIFVGLD